MSTQKKQAKQADYETVCRDLGFEARTNFVRITNNGSISFTCGKPEEIRNLAYAVRQHGYTASRQLVEAATR